MSRKFSDIRCKAAQFQSKSARFGIYIILFALCAMRCSNGNWGKFWETPNSGTTDWTIFDPKTISGLRIWLKADSLGLGNAMPVAIWSDSSGTGNSVSAGTSPIYYSTTNLINNRPVVRFSSASSQYLFLATMTGAPVTDAGSSFFVIRPNSTNGGNVFMMGGNCNGGRQFQLNNGPANLLVNKHCFTQVATVPWS